MIFAEPAFGPSLLPVLSVQERLARRGAFAAGAGRRSLVGSFAIRRFHPHIRGLEGFGRRRVLEIGGGSDISLKGFFLGIGASYRNVRLEANIERDPHVTVGDFMDVRGEFDLVISLGVFEPGALDVDFGKLEAGIIRNTPSERAAKLFGLTAKGGSCVIGTISAPCIIPSRDFVSSGFEVVHRESPFYSFMNSDREGVYDPADRSELVILRKPGKKRR